MFNASSMYGAYVFHRNLCIAESETRARSYDEAADNIMGNSQVIEKVDGHLRECRNHSHERDATLQLRLVSRPSGSHKVLSRTYRC